MSQTTQTAVGELFRQYLNNQALAQAEGLGFGASRGEVEPFDSGPVQPVDPQLAWRGALTAAEQLGPKTKTWPVPAEWSALVAAQEPTLALAFCVGNYPQLVRDVQPLLHREDHAKWRPGAGRPLVLPGLMEWAAQPGDSPRLLIAASVMRLSRHFDEAAKLLAMIEANGPWQALRQNEEAALAWHRGDAEHAEKLWGKLPESVPVLFNRGMAALFLGRGAEAAPLLDRAVERLPETDPWYHLGLLYRTLAS